jgi:hypothetical protein
MCSLAGVPQYTTLKLGSMKPHKVYIVGQCFLFQAAAFFPFTWCFMIAHYIARFKSDKLQAVSGIEKDRMDFAFENSEYKMFWWGGTAAFMGLALDRIGSRLVLVRFNRSR